MKKNVCFAIVVTIAAVLVGCTPGSNNETSFESATEISIDTESTSEQNETEVVAINTEVAETTVPEDVYDEAASYRRCYELYMSDLGLTEEGLEQIITILVEEGLESDVDSAAFMLYWVADDYTMGVRSYGEEPTPTPVQPSNNTVANSNTNANTSTSGNGTVSNNTSTDTNVPNNGQSTSGNNNGGGSSGNSNAPTIPSTNPVVPLPTTVPSNNNVTTTPTPIPTPTEPTVKLYTWYMQIQWNRNTLAIAEEEGLTLPVLPGDTYRVIEYEDGRTGALHFETYADDDALFDAADLIVAGYMDNRFYMNIGECSYLVSVEEIPISDPRVAMYQ